MKRVIIWLAYGVLAVSVFSQEAAAGLRRPYRRRRHIHHVHVRSPDIVVPTNYMIRGIDISKYQSGIDWYKLKEVDSGNNQLLFVFIKATEGTSRQDMQFKDSWKEAKEAGMLCGAYHYFYPSRNPVIQAKNFENTVNLRPGDMPPVLDIEVSNREPSRVVRKRAAIWLSEIERKYGVKPIIYTNSRFYNQYLGKSFDKYPLWISDFYSDKLPHAGRQWLFWQWSDRVHINGISSPVDFNIFNGDTAELKKILLPDQS